MQGDRRNPGVIDEAFGMLATTAGVSLMFSIFKVGKGESKGWRPRKLEDVVS